MSIGNRWPTSTKARPCPKCEKYGRCKIAADGRAGYCFTDLKTWYADAGTSGNGNGNGHGTGYIGRAHRPHNTGGNGTTAENDWRKMAERFRGTMNDERLTALADATGVPASAWSLLSPGWAEPADLLSMRSGGAGWADCPPDGAYVFAEHAGDGRTAGLSLRAADGRKGSPAGANRGLVVPANLHELPDPVLIVEGASDVAACCAMRLAAVGRPSNRAGSEDLAVMLDGRNVLVVGERDGKNGGAWPGRDGAKAVAQRLAASWDEPVRWTLPPVGAKDVREWLRGKLAAGLNVSDKDAMDAAGQELLAAVEAATKTAKPERRTQADALVDMARGRYRMGMSNDREAFAVPLDGPNVAMLLRGGGGLRAALAREFRRMTGKTPSASALADALLAIEGIAQDATPEPLGLRVAGHGDGVVVDLADTTGRAAVVTRDGWTVGTVSPVLFRWTALTAPLPEPAEAEPEALEELRELMNVDDETWPLVAGWLVAAYLPDVPHPILMLGGEQGTGKTTAARLLVGLVDPSPAATRTEPRDVEQWATTAAGSWVVALDNVSHVTRWLSDALCRAVTGDGLVRRKLYTDSELAVLSYRRCLILTSIDAGALRGDMADRLLIADLERIKDDQRRTEADLWAAYEAARPRLLGALLSAVARVLKALPGVRLEAMPRMADFSRVLAALDAACPKLTGGRALELFANQRQRIAGDVVESDLVAPAVVRMMERRPAPWEGTAAQLLDALTPEHPPRHWPTSARGLSGHLRRIVPALLAVGVNVTFDRQAGGGRSRIIKIERDSVRPSQPSQPSRNRAVASENGDAPGRSGDGAGRSDGHPGRSGGANRPAATPDISSNGDGRDGRDGTEDAHSEWAETEDNYAAAEREAIGERGM